jgi:molybdopterin synthase sulfur carrier subunit
MTTIKIPTPLRPYTDGQQEVRVKGHTVGLAVRDLSDQYPGLSKHLFDDDGRLRPYVNIFLNQDDIRTLGGEETPIKDGDLLMIVPSIAGGNAHQSTDTPFQISFQPVRNLDNYAFETALIARVISSHSVENDF